MALFIATWNNLSRACIREEEVVLKKEILQEVGILKYMAIHISASPIKLIRGEKSSLLWEKRKGPHARSE